MAIHSEEAFANGIIAKPKDWETYHTWKTQTTYPVCPQGYSRTSAYVRYHPEPNVFSTFESATKHIHCLKDEYFISQNAAKSKYGISTIQVAKPREHCAGCSQEYTPV